MRTALGALLAGGVHAEQLTISTDGITLVGRDTHLIPPATAEPNGCSRLVGTVDGGGGDGEQPLRPQRLASSVPPDLCD